MRKADLKKDEQVMRLRLKGLTFKEISAKLGMNLFVAHRRYKRAMQKLSPSSPT